MPEQPITVQPINTVRAKFRVDKIERSLWSKDEEVQTITLTPVYGGTPENEAFFKATPSGAISLGCAKAEAAKLFKLGAEYYVDFMPAI